MAFVNCSTFKNSQAEQDERLDSLEKCCDTNTKAISANKTAADNAIKDLKDSLDKNKSATDKALADLAGAGNTKDAEQDERLANLEQCCNRNSNKLKGVDSSINVTDNGLGVRISENGNNILQLRDDGLFVSVKPEDHYRRYYVHANAGNDTTGDGTAQKPFKTLGRVFADENFKNISSNVDIALYKGLTYEFNQTYAGREKTFTNVTLLAYDENHIDLSGVDAFPNSSANNIYYRGYVAKDYPRPKVVFKVQKDDARRLYFRPSILCNKFNAYGIAFLIDDAIGSGENAGYNGSYNGAISTETTAELLGCTVEWKAPTVIGTGAQGYRTDVLLRGGRINWINSQLKTDLTAGTYPTALISSNYTDKFNAIDWHGANLESYGSEPNYPTLTGNYAGVVKNINARTISSNNSGDMVNGVVLNWKLSEYA